jgi:hypothetical protein
VAATTITSLLLAVRNQLVEATARFWTDAELKEIMREGAMDLWGAILDLHQDHYLAIAEDVYLRAGDTQLSAVPANLFRVQTIEPYDLSDTGTGVEFWPKPWKSEEFRAARAQSASANIDASMGLTIYYQLSGAGSPVGQPLILTAPKITADLRVRIAYNPLLAWDDTGVNPIPGESDRALINWTVAYARAKETEERLPDPGWLQLYEDQKTKILVRLTPRQEQEPEVVEDFFGGCYQEN